MYWLKFNIYSILLTSIGVIITITAIFLYNRLAWWMISIAVLAALFFFRKAADIFRRYNYKVEIFNKLTGKLKNKYDLRYCLPYMDTACMRCVVFFALYEIGKQKDYKEVKRKAKEKCTQGNPKIVSVKTVDGHLRFTYKDVITGEYEEI